MMTRPHRRNLDGRLEADFLAFREHGEAAALARVFDASVAELLRVARHLAADRPTAEDLVQETFLVAIEKQAQFDAQRRLMPWLIGILANRARRPRPRQAPRHQDLNHAAPPDPPAAAQNREFVAAVQRAIGELPAPYRAVLDLHLTHGLSAREIARTLGRNRGTVRSQLSRGMEILRAALPTAYAMLLACGVLSGGPLAAMRRRTAREAYRSLAAGNLRDRVLRALQPVRLGLLVAAAGIGAWGITAAGEAAMPEVTAPLRSASSPAAATASASSLLAPQVPATAGRTLDRHRRRLTTGTDAEPHLTVRASFADRQPAGGVMLLTVRRSADGPLRARWRRADRNGCVEYRDLLPGEYDVLVARGGEGRATVAADRPAAIDVVIPRGVTIVGEVLDHGGNPLAGAPIQVAIGAKVRDLGTVVMRADDRGAFELRDVAPGRTISALPLDAVASWLHVVDAPPDRRHLVTLRCGGAARTIAGTVWSQAGVPLGGARVVLGAYGSPLGSGYGELPVLALCTDASGRFYCTGVPPGRVPIWIGAPGHAAWCDVLAPADSDDLPLEVHLCRGATLRGVVRDTAGAALADVLVGPRFADLDPLLCCGPTWAYVAARSDARGDYVVEHIPPGRVQWAARTGDRTTLAAPVSLADQMVVRWDPHFDAAIACQVQIVDEAGQPLAGWELEIIPPNGPAPTVQTRSDAEGRFHVLATRGADYEFWGREPASALQRPSLLGRRVRFERSSRIAVAAAQRATCRLSGRIIGPDGHPLSTAFVTVLRRRGPLLEPVGFYRAAADGEFVIDPVVPGAYGLAFGVPATGMRVVAAVQLAAGQRTRLGDLRLEQPAHLEFRARGTTATALQFAKIDSGDGAHATARLHDGIGEIMVQPGRLDVSLWGGTAAINHAMVIASAGQHIVVEIPVETGRPVAVEYALTAHRTALLRFEWIDDAGSVRHRVSSRWPPEGARVGEAVVRQMHLIPGRYLVRVTDDLGRVRESRVVFDATHQLRIDLP